MIVDIFSSFDPFINRSFSLLSYLFWLCLITPAIIIFQPFWSSSSSLIFVKSFSLEVLYEQSNRTSSTFIKGFSSIIAPLFLFLILSNLLGIIPYVFRASRHLIFTLSFGLPLWMGLIASGFSYDFKTATASLLPSGAPDWLNPFLVLIETVRALVRPLTLSFRLAANITAGHVVLGLIGSFLTSSALTSLGRISSIGAFVVQVGYVSFEIGICLIQAYIFCLLLTLYSDDHPL